MENDMAGILLLAAYLLLAYCGEMDSRK